MDFNKCKITHWPAGVLTGPARAVEKIDSKICVLIEKMTDIMLEHKGIGLAGPQAGVDLRVFIISLDGTRENVRTFINPTVEPFGELETNEEGCLSVPGIYTKIRRYKKAKVTATDIDGNKFTEEADGLYARALQHEYDHIEGITIVNRMGSAAKIVHRKQLKKLTAESEKGSSD